MHGRGFYGHFDHGRGMELSRLIATYVGCLFLFHVRFPFSFFLFFFLLFFNILLGVNLLYHTYMSVNCSVLRTVYDRSPITCLSINGLRPLVPFFMGP